MSNTLALATGSQKELRRINRNRVLRALFSANRPITRQEICHSTGLNLPLVSRVTAEMLEAGLLEEIFPTAGTDRRGRRCTALQLKADGAYVISVAITAYSQEVLIGNLKGHIIYSKNIPGFFALNPQELTRFLADAMRQALQTSAIPRQRLIGGSMALPRHMLLPGGSVSSAPLLRGSLLESLEKDLGIRLSSMRLAEVLNLAEVSWGASRGFENVLCLHMTNLVGASLLHGGSLLPPPDSIGNIAGMPVARAGMTTNELARIENKASGMSILQRLGFLSDDAKFKSYTIEDTLNLTLAHAQSLAGDAIAQAAFADAGEWMGHALETLYYVYRPDLIIFSGSLAENPYYIGAMQKAWHSLHPSGVPVETRLGTLSIGSAAILTALELHLTSPDLDLDYILLNTTP